MFPFQGTALWGCRIFCVKTSLVGDTAGPRGRGYFGARTDTTQQTNICLGIHRQICVATFNPTCLSRLLATKGLLVLRLLIVGDVKVKRRKRLMMTGTNFCFAWNTRMEEGGASALGLKNLWRIF